MSDRLLVSPREISSGVYPTKFAAVGPHSLAGNPSEDAAGDIGTHSGVE